MFELSRFITKIGTVLTMCQKILRGSVTIAIFLYTIMMWDVIVDC